jgi:hypothetical protein
MNIQEEENQRYVADAYIIDDFICLKDARTTLQYIKEICFKDNNLLLTLERCPMDRRKAGKNIKERAKEHKKEANIMKEGREVDYWTDHNPLQRRAIYFIMLLKIKRKVLIKLNRITIKSWQKIP